MVFTHPGAHNYCYNTYYGYDGIYFYYMHVKTILRIAGGIDLDLKIIFLFLVGGWMRWDPKQV